MCSYDLLCYNFCNMPDSNIKKLPKETYLKMIENSIGTKMFNSLFIHYQDTGKIADVMRNGEYSCAFFVTGLLAIFQMIDRPHATVKTLQSKLEEDDRWRHAGENSIEPGDVIFWEKVKFEDGSENK